MVAFVVTYLDHEYIFDRDDAVPLLQRKMTANITLPDEGLREE